MHAGGRKIKIKKRITSARSCCNNVTGNTGSKPVRENTHPFGCLLSATSSQGILGNYLYQIKQVEKTAVKRSQTRYSVTSHIHEKKMININRTQKKASHDLDKYGKSNSKDDFN